MKNLMLLELDELYSALEKLQGDDRLEKYSDEDQAIIILQKFINNIRKEKML